MAMVRNSVAALTVGRLSLFIKGFVENNRCDVVCLLLNNSTYQNRLAEGVNILLVWVL